MNLKALEDDLGIRLFDHAGSHVSLTRQGALRLRHAQRLAALASEAQQELAAGRKVYLSIGSAGRVPRRYRGRDINDWFTRIGMFGTKVGN